MKDPHDVRFWQLKTLLLYAFVAILCIILGFNLGMAIMTASGMIIFYVIGLVGLLIWFNEYVKLHEVNDLT